MQKELLKQYSEIRWKIKEYEEVEASLKLKILEDFEKNKLDKVESDYGKFTVGHKTSWTYSKKLQDATERLKLAQLKEQEKGTAEAKMTTYLLYKVNKE